jgi:hypothetical protein
MQIKQQSTMMMMTSADFLSREDLNRRQRELETFLAVKMPLKRVRVCGDEGPLHLSSTFVSAFVHWYYNTEFKVDGSDWSNGSFGSRWCDPELAGRRVRVAYYSRASDPQMFNANDDGFHHKLMVMYNYFA